MRLSEKIFALLILLILGIMLAAVALTSEGMTGLAVVIALVVIAGATQILGSMFFGKLTKMAGEAFFEDRPPEEFDVDAVFERAMRKRDEQSSQSE